MRVTSEFPHFNTNTLPIIPSHWEDVSWHNDCCPSWLIGDIVVFIDFIDLSDRELGQNDRFVVTHKDTCDTLISTNDWQQVLDFVSNYRG